MVELSNFVDFVFGWLDEWEIRELERIRARSPIKATATAGTERWVDFENRRRVAEMSREEMQRELLTSGVTCLPNRRAFDEAGQGRQSR